MEIVFEKPTIYMSHPIRGSNNDIQGNCKKALAAGRRLARVFPEIDFYIPAAHDLTMQILTQDGKLTIDDVMYADLEILRVCHGWMFYNFDDSAGSRMEWKEAYEIGLTNEFDNWYLYDIEKASYQKLRKDFANLIDATLKRFREKE
jgi:hypothetical protein